MTEGAADPAPAAGPLGGGRRASRVLPLALALAAIVFALVAYLRERFEETPRIPYDLQEYAGVTPADLGTVPLFDDPEALKIRIRARRPGRVRFILAGDGGQDEDSGKRALSREMEELCRRAPCDFLLFAGDNAYPRGIDTFSGRFLADSIPGFDLQSEFLGGLEPEAAGALAARVRAAVGRVARACGRAESVPLLAEGGDGRRSAAGAAAMDANGAFAATDANDSFTATAASDSSAALAFRRHFEPKFERTFGWLRRSRVPAFLVLGNHDARSAFGAECEIGYSLGPGTAWSMPYYFYEVEVAGPGGGPPLAAVFALDSSAPHGSRAGENAVRIGPRQRAWLTRSLAASEARWTIAASHHPVWSAGRHVVTEYLSFDRDVLDVARVAGRGFDLLLAGHNHWLESVKVTLNGAPALQLVSGALSKVSLAPMLARGYPLFDTIALDGEWRDRLRRDLRTDPTAFLEADRSVLARGFALVELTAREARVRFYGVEGPFYTETFSREASASRSTLPRGRADVETRENQP